MIFYLFCFFFLCFGLCLALFCGLCFCKGLGFLDGNSFFFSLLLRHSPEAKVLEHSALLSDSIVDVNHVLAKVLDHCFEDVVRFRVFNWTLFGTIMELDVFILERSSSVWVLNPCNQFLNEFNIACEIQNVLPFSAVVLFELLFDRVLEGKHVFVDGSVISHAEMLVHLVEFEGDVLVSVGIVGGHWT